MLPGIFRLFLCWPSVHIHYFNTFQGYCCREVKHPPWHPPFCSCCPLSPLQHYPQYANISDSSATTPNIHTQTQMHTERVPNPPAELKQAGKSKNSQRIGLTREKESMWELGGGGGDLQSKIAEAVLSIRLFMEHNWSKICHDVMRNTLVKVRHLFLALRGVFMFKLKDSVKET